jgi:glycosyltransferase involved in cell wall biosynthesis
MSPISLITGAEGGVLMDDLETAHRHRGRNEFVPERVHFLMFTADGADGVCRSVLNLANHLCERHPVEIISVYRRRATPASRIDGRIRVRYLVDLRDDGPPGRLRQWLARRPSYLVDRAVARRLSLLTDLQMLRTLGRLAPGILISTRPTLHLASTRLASRRLVKIGQDHLNYPYRARENGLLGVIERAALGGLDAFVTLTSEDAADYRRLFGDRGALVAPIPNALSWPLQGRSQLDSKIVLTAGRLVRRKGMDRLIRAFAPVARTHPDWELHIYGKGQLEPSLRRQIDECGMSDRIRMMGHTRDLATVMESASIFVTASRAEGFPMVLLEAMSKGLPLVAVDCPRGPRDIVRDGDNGRLVPNGDLLALSRALEDMMGDADARRRMGARARADAENYTMDGVAAQWERLFQTLRQRRSALSRGHRTPARPRVLDRIL